MDGETFAGLHGKIEAVTAAVQAASTEQFKIRMSGGSATPGKAPSSGTGSPWRRLLRRSVFWDSPASRPSSGSQPRKVPLSALNGEGGPRRLRVDIPGSQPESPRRPGGALPLSQPATPVTRPVMADASGQEDQQAPSEQEKAEEGMVRRLASTPARIQQRGGGRVEVQLDSVRVVDSSDQEQEGAASPRPLSPAAQPVRPIKGTKPGQERDVGAAAVTFSLDSGTERGGSSRTLGAAQRLDSPGPPRSAVGFKCPLMIGLALPPVSAHFLHMYMHAGVWLGLQAACRCLPRHLPLVLRYRARAPPIHQPPPCTGHHLAH